MVRLNSKLIDAASNVVRLPTAVPRQPENYRFAAQRAARIAKRREEPWPGEYVHPHTRSARKLAKQLREIEQTPALIIASAILATMDRGMYLRVMEQLAPGEISGRTAMVQAFASARASGLNNGEHLDLLNALEWLNGKDR